MGLRASWRSRPGLRGHETNPRQRRRAPRGSGRERSPSKNLLVSYTSVLGRRPGTGVGHFESKWRIEEHARASGLLATIVRPGTFMELLLVPSFGLSPWGLQFFVHPDQPMQLIAGEDIGVLTARVFAEPRTHVGTTLEMAGDSLTGNALAEKIRRATGTSITCARFPSEVLDASPMLRKLVKLFDDGMVAERADIPALRRMAPGLLTFDAWLERGDAAAIRERVAAWRPAGGFQPRRKNTAG